MRVSILLSFNSRSRKATQAGAMPALVALISALALTGCTLYDPPPKPLKITSETTTHEWCGDARELVGNPYFDADIKQAVLEAMRSRGCSATNPA
jgi:hypothetical protein